MVQTPIIPIEPKTPREEALCAMGDTAIHIGFCLGRLSTATSKKSSFEIIAQNQKFMEALAGLDFEKLKDGLEELAKEDPGWSDVAEAMEDLIEDVVEFNAMKVELPAKEAAT